MSKLLEQINRENRVRSIKDLVFPVSNTYDFSNIEKVVFINTGDVYEGKFLHKNYSSTKKLPGQAKKIIESGDILFSEIRPKNRHFALVDFDSKDYVVSTKLIVLKVKENIDPKYAYIVLTANQNLKEFQNIAESRSGTFPQITFESIADYEVNIPDVAIQKKIADILSAYDSKIENNNKIIKNLELTAQTIFNEWFVNFKFPGYEKVKMVDSEMGEIPERWKVGKISDFGDVVCGKTPSKTQSEYFNGEFPFIKIPDMHGQMFILQTEDSLTQEGVDTQKNKLVPEGSVCVSCIATVGLVSITTQSSQTNQQINTVVPKNKEFTEYLYFVLTSMKSDLQAIGSGGSTTLNVNTSVFSDLEVLIPDEDLINIFHKKIDPFFNQTKQLLKENVSLKESRDQLLAKLI